LLARNVVPELLAQGEEDEEIDWIVNVLMNGITPKKQSKTESDTDEESH
jgi:hypothetical protein